MTNKMEPGAVPPSREPPSRETQIKTLIRRRYAHLATTGLNPAQSGGHTGKEKALQAGYPPESLKMFSDRTLELYSGCGFPFSGGDLSAIKVAVDLGCGMGLDACIAASTMPTDSVVIAIDLTPEMLGRVVETHAQSKSNSGGASVLPIAGDVESIPLADGCADAVFANAAFNLSLDPVQAYREAARILRPGGRLMACDLVLDGDLPEDLGKDPMGWNTSLGGVMGEDDLSGIIQSGGFDLIRIFEHRKFGHVLAVRIDAVKT